MHCVGQFINDCPYPECRCAQKLVSDKRSYLGDDFDRYWDMRCTLAKLELYAYIEAADFAERMISLYAETGVLIVNNHNGYEYSIEDGLIVRRPTGILKK